LRSRIGKNRPNAGAALLQLPDQLERLVGGDSAANDQKDALALKGQNGLLQKDANFGGLSNKLR